MENDYLPLAQVRPGMMLAADLRDTGGHLLVPGGVALTQELLARLASQGIGTVPVRRQCHDRLDYLFRNTDPGSPDAWAADALRDHLRAWRAGAGE